MQLDTTCLLAQLRAVVEASSGDAAAICKALTDGLDELRSQSNDFTSVFATVSLLPAESSFWNCNDDECGGLVSVTICLEWSVKLKSIFQSCYFAIVWEFLVGLTCP